MDQREDRRDSLFLMATLRLATEEYPVKVRNLSAGGAMLEGEAEVARGDRVEVRIRNVGWVEGVVAWTALPRFGIAFDLAIDPEAARSPVTGTPGAPVGPGDGHGLRRV